MIKLVTHTFKDSHNDRRSIFNREQNKYEMALSIHPGIPHEKYVGASECWMYRTKCNVSHYVDRQQTANAHDFVFETYLPQLAHTLVRNPSAETE